MSRQTRFGSEPRSRPPTRPTNIRVHIPKFSQLDPRVTKRELRRIYVDRLARENEVEFRAMLHRERQAANREARNGT